LASEQQTLHQLFLFKIFSVGVHIVYPRRSYPESQIPRAEGIVSQLDTEKTGMDHKLA